jgi:hypothetical protein
MSARPNYETQDDVDAQSRVLDDLALAWKCEWVPLPKFYETDAALMRGREVMAFVEVKCRNAERRTYPTLILSVHKWLYLRALGERLRAKSILVVGYTDGIFWLDVKAAELPPIVFGGRADRGDGQDIEPCVDIPIGLFKPLRRDD